MHVHSIIFRSAEINLTINCILHQCPSPIAALHCMGLVICEFVRGKILQFAAHLAAMALVGTQAGIV